MNQQNEENNGTSPEMKTKGIQVIVLILFFFALSCSLVFHHINNPENPQGNVSDGLLDTVVCKAQNKTLRQVVSEKMSGYHLHHKNVSRDMSDNEDGNDVNTLVIVTVQALVKMPDGHNESAEIILDLTSALYSKDFDMVVYGAKVNNVPVTDKAKLAELKDHLCGVTSGRSYI